MSGPRICGHCGQLAQGYAFAEGVPLCHPLGVFEDPNAPPPVDCYHLVTVWGHDVPCDMKREDSWRPVRVVGPDQLVTGCHHPPGQPHHYSCSMAE